MSSWFWRIVLSMIVVTAATESESFACICMSSGPPCQAAWASDVVFTGTVLSIEAVEIKTWETVYPSKLVTFSIDRGFINSPSGSAEVMTGAGGGDCGYRFTPGGTYLVYARKGESSRLSTSICSRTRPIEQAEEDIRYLTTVATNPERSRVYGRVNEYRRDPAEEQAVDYGPVEGLTVTVRGDTFVRDAVTDANGKFEIAPLPVGKATLTSVAPFGYEPSIFEHEIEIRDPRACREINLSIQPVARASGVVIDASGRPAAAIYIDAVAAELAGFAPPPHQIPVKTNDHGIFEFEHLPPGVYVFGTNLTNRPEGPPLFLPGTRVAREARVVELRAGDCKDVGVLRLVER
jgi:hypothetical protein